MSPTHIHSHMLPYLFFLRIDVLDILSSSHSQSSQWAPALLPKISKTLFEPVNFSVFISIYEINSRLRIGPVNSNFHFKDCCWVQTPFCTFHLFGENLFFFMKTMAGPPFFFVQTTKIVIVYFSKDLYSRNEFLISVIIFS